MKFGYCKVEGCTHTNYHSKGYCNMHYKRLRRNGTLERIVKDWSNENKKYVYNYGDRYSGANLKSMHKKRFGGMREFILERDGYKCVECGMTNEEHKNMFNRNLTINHKDHQGRYVKNPNNDSSNLETLCLPCHGRKDNPGNKIIGGKERE